MFEILTVLRKKRENTKILSLCVRDMSSEEKPFKRCDFYGVGRKAHDFSFMKVIFDVPAWHPDVNTQQTVKTRAAGEKSV